MGPACLPTHRKREGRKVRYRFCACFADSEFQTPRDDSRRDLDVDAVLCMHPALGPFIIVIPNPHGNSRAWLRECVFFHILRLLIFLNAVFADAAER